MNSLFFMNGEIIVNVFRRKFMQEYKAFNWRTVKSITESGDLEQFLQEGDQVTLKLKNGDEILLDFTHDQNGKAYFVFHNCYGKQRMNRVATNMGGWRECEMRKYVTEQVLPLLPDDLMETIVQTTIRQIVNGEELQLEDKLFLLSYAQVFGGKWDDEPDDTQLEIFKLGVNRVKGNDKGDAAWWHLRTTSEDTDFCNVSSQGTPAACSADIFSGVILAFCITK